MQHLSHDDIMISYKFCMLLFLVRKVKGRVQKVHVHDNNTQNIIALMDAHLMFVLCFVCGGVCVFYVCAHTYKHACIMVHACT